MRHVAFWVLVSMTAAGVAHAETVVLSAPILPKVLTLYAQQGESFPSTLEGEQALVHDAALVFEQLLDDCALNPSYAGAYDGITLRGPGDPELTPEQLSTNYALVALCSYQQYTAKPYWIPRLIDDVDVCGATLGEGWRLPTEADLASFTDDDCVGFRDTLSAVAGGGDLGAFYFSLRVYVRGADGSLLQGDLTPGISPRVTPFPEATDPIVHYESDLSLRCLRVTP
jgi:hypothetical protein